MPRVHPETNFRIHTVVNLTLWLILAAGAGAGLWFVLRSLWAWIPAFLITAWGVGVVVEHWVPKATGPLIDAVFQPSDRHPD